MKKLFLFLALTGQCFAAVSTQYTVYANPDGTLKTLPNGVAVQGGGGGGGSGTVSTGAAGQATGYNSNGTTVGPISVLTFNSAGISVGSAQTTYTGIDINNTSTNGNGWSLRSNGQVASTPGSLSIVNSSTGANGVSYRNDGTHLSSGSLVATPATIAALAVDVAKATNIKTIAVDSAFTFSATPPTGQWFMLQVTNSDSVGHIITIPSSFDVNSQALKTTFNILPGGTETITWTYDGARFIAYGIPGTAYTAPATVASAGTTDIGAANSANVNITGTTTITSFGTVASGTYRQGYFSAALTLTNNGTSLILPANGNNITTAAGDSFGAISLGSGNWKVLFYSPASGTITGVEPITKGGTGATTASGAWDALNSGEATVASAATTDLGAVASDKVSITGTTTITALGSASGGVFRRGRFTGILTLTHNATSLILPGAANITTAAGDRFTAYSLGGGNWVVADYTKASGMPTALVSLTAGVTGILPGTNGGTGVNNSTRTMTYAGNVAFTGAFNPTFVIPASVSYTYPSIAATLASLASNSWTQSAVTASAGTLTVDFSTNSKQTYAMGADTTFASANLAAHREVTIFITADATIRNFTFPGGWITVGGAKPTSIAASKNAKLILSSTGTTDAAVFMDYRVQP